MLNRHVKALRICPTQATILSERPEGKERVLERTINENVTNSEVKGNVVILHWTKAFNLIPSVNINPGSWPFFYTGNNCPITCELTTDKKGIQEASALIIYARNMDEMSQRHLKNITWILHTSENPVYTKSLSDPNIMSQFNYLVSYRLDSDFACPEFLKPRLDTPVPFQEKRGLVIVALSHCQLVRTLYVKQLMNYIEVDSYGGCLKNKDGLTGKGGETARRAVLELQRKYKFILTFANADCDYYDKKDLYCSVCR